MKTKHDQRSHQHPSPERTTAGTPADADKVPVVTNSDGVQGEGNYEAARVFNEAERKFVASGKVEAAARAAAPTSATEQQEMLSAEQEGKRRAKGSNAPSSTAILDRAAAEPCIDAPGRKRG